MDTETKDPSKIKDILPVHFLNINVLTKLKKNSKTF